MHTHSFVQGSPSPPGFGTRPKNARSDCLPPGRPLSSISSLLYLKNPRPPMSESSASPTPVSLLQRLRETHAEEDWRRFVRLYTPLLLYWARRLCRAPADPADLVQEVFAKLTTELPRFRYDPQRRFRGWLHTILLNRWRDEERRRRHSLQTSAPEVLDQLETTDNVDDWTEEQYRAYLVGRALEVMRAEFAPRDWQRFWEGAVN